VNAIFGLHLAVVSGQVQVVEFLLKGGHAAECVNKRDRRMDTPLHLAAVSRHEPIIQLLIDHGQLLLLFFLLPPKSGLLTFVVIVVVVVLFSCRSQCQNGGQARQEAH